MAHMQNTTPHFRITCCRTSPCGSSFVRSSAFRLHEAPVNHPVAAPYGVNALGDRFELAPGGDLPPLRMFLYGEEKAFTITPESFEKRDLCPRAQSRIRVLRKPVDARLLPLSTETRCAGNARSRQQSRGKPSARSIRCAAAGGGNTGAGASWPTPGHPTALQGSSCSQPISS